MVQRYAVILERGDRNWSAFIPDLPVCIGTARTRDEMLAKMRSLAAFHIEGLLADGLPVPEPGSGDYVPSPADDMVFIDVPVPAEAA